MRNPRKKAIFYFPDLMDREPETWEITKVGDYWMPAHSHEPMLLADRVIAEDGQVLKDRDGVLP